MTARGIETSWDSDRRPGVQRIPLIPVPGVPVSKIDQHSTLRNVADVVKNRLDETDMETRVLRDYVTARR